jgi:hemolysin activation/secretion protein
VGHEFRPGSEGLTIAGQFTYAWTEPDLGPGGPEIKARTLYAGLSARYPVERTQGANLWLGAGFDYVDQDVDLVAPATVLSRDKLRIVWLRADYDAVDLRSRRPAWRLGGTFELRRGIDVFNTRRNCGTVACAVPGDPTATVVRASAEGELALGPDVALAVLPRGQYAFDPLASFEKFTAGNYTVGRGFDPGTLTGDSGVGVSVELRGPRFKPFATFEGRVQPYVFADAAWVWNRDDLVSGSERLTSAGGGLRAALGDRFRLDAMLAVPLERAGLQTKRHDPRFLISLTTRLLPWRTN